MFSPCDEPGQNLGMIAFRLFVFNTKELSHVYTLVGKVQQVFPQTT
jgi:hypothetical protein